MFDNDLRPDPIRVERALRYSNNGFYLGGTITFVTVIGLGSWLGSHILFSDEASNKFGITAYSISLLSIAIASARAMAKIIQLIGGCVSFFADDQSPANLGERLTTGFDLIQLCRESNSSSSTTHRDRRPQF